MRLYTIESENKQYVAVEGKDGRPVTLDSLGIIVKDMNELIRRFDEISLLIASRLEKEPPKKLGHEYKIKGGFWHDGGYPASPLMHIYN